jgi:hypothetical protein
LERHNKTRFETAFPFTTEKEKEAEKAYIEKNYAVVQDAQVKGLWVTSDVALQLAREYNIEEYIRAMKDASPDKPSDSLTLTASTTTSKPSVSGSAPSTPTPKTEVPLRRSRRSVSPKKSSRASKTTTPKAPSLTTSRGRKKKGSTIDGESVASLSPVVPPAVAPKAEATANATEEQKPYLDTIEVPVPSAILKPSN